MRSSFDSRQFEGFWFDRFPLAVEIFLHSLHLFVIMFIGCLFLPCWFASVFFFCFLLDHSRLTVDYRLQQRVMIKSGLISVALVRPKQREAIYLPTTKEREEEDLSYHQRLAVLLPWRLLLFNVKDSKKAGKGASSLAADAGEGSPRLTR